MNEPLSFFYKILILVEDKGHVSLNDLVTLGTTRQALGALGRLEGLGYIERHKEDKETYFTLTEKGDDALAEILDRMPSSEQPWDGSWYLILFDIPESKRTLRQMFRLKLMDLGAQMLQSSVWITPSHKVVEHFQNQVNEHDVSDLVYVFKTQLLDNEKLNIAKLWHLNDLEQSYKTLFKECEKTLSRGKNQKDASYHAKCNIVSLALLARKDPQLPEALMPKGWVGHTAEAWYKKLRAFCS